MLIRSSLFALVIILLSSLPVRAVQHVSIMRDGKPYHLSGKILVEAQDGGLLLMTPDGMLWALLTEEIQSRESDNTPFKPYDKKQLAKQLLKEMGDGFRIHSTAHFVICYNTTKAYAQWCGGLYERLYRGFQNYWKNLGVKIHAPQQPLVALVFRDQQSYAKYARHELGSATETVDAYYSLRSNRVIMYDITGVEGFTPASVRIKTSARVNTILSQPEAARNVATIVHEATHQLAFNSGLHTRYADVPKWVSEGIAVYFETPDLKSSRGWKGIGSVNRVRLFRFNRMLRNRPGASLKTLLQDDKRFLDSSTAEDAYAEAWALTYYLMKTRRDDYVKYIQTLSAKKPLLYDQPQERLDLFTAIFGDIYALDATFVKYMRKFIQ